MIATAALFALVAGCGSAAPSFSGAVTMWRPLDLGRISVTYRARNDGPVATRVECSLEAVIPSGNTIQKMSFSDRVVPPGSSVRVSEVIPVPDQAAYLVDHVTAGPCDALDAAPPSGEA
jgi:hypothetical protein